MVTVPPGPRSARRAIAWWEQRRLGYNVWLCLVGSVSLALHAGAAWLTMGAAPSLGALVQTAAKPLLIANVLYTLGWIWETDPRLGPTRDRVAIGAFLEVWCWVIGIVLVGAALTEFMPAVGTWMRRS
jgi:hypothetical protein